MTNPYYNPTGVPATRAALSSATQRIEFAAIGTAFDKLAPTLTANGLLHVNAAGTAYAAHTVITVSAAGAIAGVTDLTTTGNTALGNAVGDTLSVSGTAIKNATGNWSIPAPSSGNALAVTGIAGSRAIVTDTGAAATPSGIDFKRNGTLTALVANAGATNDFVTGSAQGDQVYRTENGAHRFVTAGGARTPMLIADAGNVTIASPSSGYGLRLPQQTPASAAAAGTAGDIAVDANFFYACTATNTWKRVALATW